MRLNFPAIADRGDPEMDAKKNNDKNSARNRTRVPTEVSRSTEWYAAGDEWIVDVGGIWMVVRFVGRKGRRGRIAIIATTWNS